MPLWEGSPPTSGQVHCSSLPSCSLMHFSLYTRTYPLFHTFHYHGSSTVLYFYPSFQLLHVGWVAAAGRGHQVARGGSESNAGKIFDSNSLLPRVGGVASVHFSSWSRCKRNVKVSDLKTVSMVLEIMSLFLGFSATFDPLLVCCSVWTSRHDVATFHWKWHCFHLCLFSWICRYLEQLTNLYGRMISQQLHMLQFTAI